jgi:hypothetical protein
MTLRTTPRTSASFSARFSAWTLIVPTTLCDPTHQFVLRLRVPVPYSECRPCGEIWAYGLRNPWRITFDRLTGDLFIGDVGQNSREEIDLQPATGPTGSEFGGRNYGWRCKEGFADHINTPPCTGTLVPPILDYTHGEGCAVTGGYRYRGAQLPSLQGVYVFAISVAAICATRVSPDGDAAAPPLIRPLARIHGGSYVADLGGPHRTPPGRGQSGRRGTERVRS